MTWCGAWGGAWPCTDAWDRGWERGWERVHRHVACAPLPTRALPSRRRCPMARCTSSRSVAGVPWSLRACVRACMRAYVHACMRACTPQVPPRACARKCSRWPSLWVILWPPACTRTKQHAWRRPRACTPRARAQTLLPSPARLRWAPTRTDTTTLLLPLHPPPSVLRPLVR